MPNTDPIGEALGKEGTSSLIPSIPPIFNNGLDSRDSRPLPYPQPLDSGNFPISDAEDSSLIDSIIEPPGSIVNELNADAEADTLILNQTDSSSLIKELISPLNDSQPTNSELDTLIGSLQEEPGIPSEQKTDPLLNPSSTAEDNSTILDSPITTAISTQNNTSELLESLENIPLHPTPELTDSIPTYQQQPIAKSDRPETVTNSDSNELVDTGETIAIATDNANTNNNQETTQTPSVNSTQAENSNNPVSSTIESEVESEPPSNSHLNPVQTGADDLTSATIPENAALVDTTPLVAVEVKPTVTDSSKIEEIKQTVVTVSSTTEELESRVVTDSSKTEEVKSTIATDSSTTEQIESIVVSDSNTADEIQPIVVTDSNTTEEIKPTIATDSSTTEQIQSTIVTDLSKTEQIEPIVVTDSSTTEQVKETVEFSLPTPAENQTAIVTSNTAEEVKETVEPPLLTSDQVEPRVETGLPTSDQVEPAVNTASNTEQTGDNTTKQEPISSELNNDSNLNLIEPTLSTQQPDNTTATEQNPTLLQLPTQTEPQTPNPENQTANIPNTLTENNNTSSNSSPTIAQQTNNNPTFTSGIFTVDSTGIVSIDYLFDGGFYQGELAVFSLRNMEEFTPGTPEFIAEAARRVLTNSELGNIPIKDSTQAARFSGTMPDDGNWDAGEYQNPITFNMTPGDTFGIMLIPNGTVQQVFDNPNIDGTNRPLFSLSTANPASGFQLGQIADVTGNGNTFAYEDLRADGWTDKDYNDMIFTITGATGIAPLLSSVIDPSKEWRNSPVGQELLDYVLTLTSDHTPPAISAELIQDTGSSSSDLLTNNPTISGTVTDSSSITSFSASFNNNSTNIELNNLLAPDGSFTLTRDILTTINNGSELPDGSHTLGLQAVDIHGNTSSFELAFTLDTTTSLTLSLDPAFDTVPIGDSDTENSTVTLIGQAEPNSTIVLLGTGTVATVATANATGQFQFPGVILTPGSNSFTATATDKAGNTSTTTLTVNNNPVSESEIEWLAEGESFTQILERTFEIPSSPSILSVNIATIYFDTSDPDSINDAFEIALLDENGKSLVHTIAPGRDSFFNLTEGQSAQLAAGVTNTGSTITLDLSQIAPGTAAKVQLRLVNNDSDTATKIGIASVSIQPFSTTTPPIATPATENSASTPVNFSNLEDVSASLEPEYKQTSFNDKTNVLYTDISVRNGGQYPVRGSLLVGIDNISDPTVRVLGTDGTTPEGIPYYNFTDLVSGGILKSGELTGTGTLKFYNPNEPNGVQFTYDLVFLSELNSEPEFVGEPNKEAVVGKSYAYQAIAIDPDGDAVTYSLLEKPLGMEIDSASGKITWNPSNENIGNHSVTVQVEDGKGGVDKLEYILSAIAPPPNRPPIFTSTPVVDANVNTFYSYEAIAKDADSDALTFSLVSGPEGILVNSNTGAVTWMPTSDQLGLSDVVLRVADGKGGTAEQAFKVQIQKEPGNHAPIITSEPETKFFINAETLLFDNFNTEAGGNPTLGLVNFANWNVTRGDIDILGRGLTVGDRNHNHSRPQSGFCRDHIK